MGFVMTAADLAKEAALQARKGKPPSGWKETTGTRGMGSLINIFAQQQASARAANIARYQQAAGLYQQALGRYGPGGTFGRGLEAQLGRTKVRDVAGGAQALAQSGLFGTTMRAGLGKKWEEEVGVPARLKLEDIRMERLTEAERALAGLIERREDVGPDIGMMAQLLSSIG